MPRKHSRYTQRDLFVDGVRLAASAAIIVCLIAALRGF